MALWPPIWMFLLPLLMLVYLLVGFASVMTLSVGFFCIIIFAITAYMGITPPVYILYGVGALILTAIALRPNLKRLKNGTERAVGLRRYLEKKREAKNASHDEQVNPLPARFRSPLLRLYFLTEFQFCTFERNLFEQEVHIAAVQFRSQPPQEHAAFPAGDQVDRFQGFLGVTLASSGFDRLFQRSQVSQVALHRFVYLTRAG